MGSWGQETVQACTFWGVLNVTLSWDLVLPFKFLGKGGSDDFCVSRGAPTDPLEEVMVFGDAQSLQGELRELRWGFRGLSRNLLLYEVRIKHYKETDKSDNKS